MKWRPISGIVLRQVYLLRGSAIRVFPLFVWVAVDMLLWGFLTRYLNQVTGQGHDFVPQLLGAVLFWDFLSRVMLGVSVAFLEDIWSRNFLNLFSTPLTVHEYLCGLILVGIGTSLIGLLVMLGLAMLIFGLSFAPLGLLLGHAVFILLVFGVSLGILACSIVLRFGPAAEWMTWPIPTLLAPFAGVFYPVASLPAWMQAVSVMIPPSHVFEAMRAALLEGKLVQSQLWTADLMAVGYLVLAAWGFGRVFKRVVGTGQLARYAAEVGA